MLHSKRRNHLKPPENQLIFYSIHLKSPTVKKNHTRKKGGAQLSISFWHLLMNLKNKYLLKKLLKWANKKHNNLNIYNAAFFSKNQNFEKMKKIAGDIIILQMSTKNNNHMMYGS